MECNPYAEAIGRESVAQARLLPTHTRRSYAKPDSDNRKGSSTASNMGSKSNKNTKEPMSSKTLQQTTTTTTTVVLGDVDGVETGAGKEMGTTAAARW